MITFLCTLLVASSLCTLSINYLPPKSILVASFPGHPGLQFVWNSHVYIFGHMKLRLGKMVLIGNESLEEGAGDAA